MYIHAKEELDLAVIKLYNDYKDLIKKHNDGDLRYIYKIQEINNEEKKYNEEEAKYIGINALLMLQADRINNNKINY